jgi:methylenetetrahydrofolate--tRNA-(uracil-5-)-methyltransferase
LRDSYQEIYLADLTVVGGGLAGSEAAWQAAESGVKVAIFEMRPVKMTGAHVSDRLGELVCSNSLGSNLVDRASGMLKEELRRLGSMLLRCAEVCALPAGSALAVDRQAFAEAVTQQINNHPNISVIRSEVTQIPVTPTIIASGPLTSPTLTTAIQDFSGQDRLFFYDAIAPIVQAESIDMEIAFRASRFGLGEQEGGDYINCPLDANQYQAFVDALKSAERIELREFELEVRQGVKAGMHRFFEGCLPVEVIAERGEKALEFGPMRPIGLRNPHTGHRPHAVVQLRQDNLAGSLYNMVGFQTNLTYSEQQRVFRMIPGLEKAEFARFGQMHRNTFIASPILIWPTMQSRLRADLFFAGQITGVEGYMGNIATGLLAGMNMARYLHGQPLVTLPQTTMLGALCAYITSADLKDFQPMKSNYGILPPLPQRPQGRKERNQQYLAHGLAELRAYCSEMDIPLNEKSS